jgi:putative tricarboxylic transport membrane protein
MTTLHARAEVAVPALLALIGVAALIAGIGYGLTDDKGQVGTGLLPVVAGGALAFLAVAEVISARRRQAAGSPQAATETRDPGPDIDIQGRTPGQRVRILATVLGVVILTVALVPVLGFLLSFAGLLFVITMAVERMGVLKSAAVTVITIAVIWFVFAQFLSIPMPQGMLGLI